MPRHRKIQCGHCGFRQLKSDMSCEGCGRMSVIAKKRVVFSITGFLVLVISIGAWIQFVGDKLVNFPR